MKRIPIWKYFLWVISGIAVIAFLIWMASIWPNPYANYAENREELMDALIVTQRFYGPERRLPTQAEYWKEYENARKSGDLLHPIPNTWKIRFEWKPNKNPRDSVLFIELVSPTGEKIANDFLFFRQGDRYWY